MRDTMVSAFTAPISQQIWEKKYRHQDHDGTIHDFTVEDSWRRIANALSMAEHPDERAEYSDQFYDVLTDFKFLPAGRITAGAGTGRNVTMFNCFVMGTVPDSMDGIFSMLKEAALTMQQGGGIGYDFSTIRPKGQLVKGVSADASGPLTFMDCWDAMCRTVMSAGSRRGAMMATMRCDHPDILDFITAKQESARLRMFNLSVLVTDAFMECVKDDHMWELVWDGEVKSEIPARELWDLIMKSTYDFAEPGCIFVDRINETNNLKAIETISATNPCGEQPLPPYGACLLGSINLARFIEQPFADDAHLDDVKLGKVVATAVRMMDNVNDLSNFPLDAQRNEAQAKRRIGLGITGLADALIMLGITYGSEEAVQMTEAWMYQVEHMAYKASINLAKEKGPFPLFSEDRYLIEGSHIMQHTDLLPDIKKHGIRNSHISSIAPTGTISLYAGNVSSGIEPVFAYSYFRKVLQDDGSKIEEEVVDYAVQMYREMFPDATELPDYFVSAQTLPPEAHVRMQAAAQNWVDTSISKTINCPEDISFEEFKDIYMLAYETGCKGCTTYRPNAVTGSVLSVESETQPQVEVIATQGLPERQTELSGKTYKMKWPTMPHSFYITINDDDAGRPYEIFITTQNIEAQAWIAALTRMVSAVFRRGGDTSFVATELQQIHDPQGGAWTGGQYMPSLVAAIGKIVQQHMGLQRDVSQDAALTICSSCGELAMAKLSGCETCTSCGHSKCG